MRSITDYLEYVNKYLYSKQNIWQQYGRKLKEKYRPTGIYYLDLNAVTIAWLVQLFGDSEQKSHSAEINIGGISARLIFLGRLSRAFNLFPHFAFSLCRMQTVIVRDIFHVDRNELTRPPSSGQSEYSMLKWTRSWNM